MLISLVAVTNTLPKSKEGIILFLVLVAIAIVGVLIWTLVDSVVDLIQTTLRNKAKAVWELEHRCKGITKKGVQCHNFDCHIH
jgi:hypothetical protein